MQNINEIGKTPEELNNHDNNLKNGKLFFTDKEAKLFTKWGREAVESQGQQSCLFYKIDLKKTNAHKLYGESKVKSYLAPIEICGRINTESKDSSYHVEGGIPKKGLGNIVLHVYLEHLMELGLAYKNTEQKIVTEIKIGDHIGYKGQFYRIFDDGYSNISNNYTFVGDRRFYITIKGNEVDDDSFNAR